MSDNEERQEQELSAVKAIYPELIDLRTERIKPHTTHQKKNNRQPTWRPIEIQITLKPNSDDVYVRADLYVKCSIKYPQEAPIDIQIKNVVGLSKINVKKLEKELIKFCGELAEKDEESLFMCINKVEEFLNQNNKPAPKSFYDQMLSNQMKQQEEERRLKLEKISKDRQNEIKLTEQLKQAMYEKQKLLENENRKLRRASFLEDEVTSSINSLKASISTIKEQFIINLSSFKENIQPGKQKSLRTCSKNHQFTQTDSNIKFKTITGNELHIQKLSCDLHSDLHTDYLAIQKDSSTFYLLSEFQNLKLNVSKEEKTKLMKELLNIRTKFEHKLLNLNHSHIIQPIAFTYTLENDLVSLRLLSDFVPHNIRFYDLPIVLSNFEQQEIRSSFYFIQILDAINYLHSNHICHGSLSPENVILDLETGQIKLINHLIQIYLYDFINLINNPSKSSNPQSLELDYNRDYVGFGFLISWFKLKFKLDFKQLITIKRTDLFKMLQDCGCSSLELELIKNCLNRTSITVLETILVEYFQKACENLNENLKKTTHIIDDIENDQTAKNNLAELAVTSKHSRLSDFEIISKLGQGGFGEVYKVRNNLDQNLYALKKIEINTTNKLLNKKIKQEVRYLSALCHENVVRYYSSWIEYEFANKNNKVDGMSDDSDKDYFSDESTDEDEETEDLTDPSHLFSNSLRVPEIKNENDDLSDSYVVFQDSQDGDKNHKKSDDEMADPCNKSITKKSTNNILPFNEIMYIQMELCERSTLHHAINSQQLFQDNRRSRRLFREIIEALAYIHAKCIVHRDLKPGNIFLDSQDRVKIGDFGLATGYVNELLRVEPSSNHEILAITHSSHLNSNSTNQSNALNQKSEIVGTPFYLSPEIQIKSQDHSTKKITYTQKVDIYSAGIIFFEMCYRLPGTGMERFILLNNLRLPEIIFPSDVEEYLNKEEQCLIKKLLNHNPKERPTSSELLESEYLPPLEIEEAKQQVMIRQVIQNPRSKQHKFLLNTLFNRQMNNVEDIVYDSEIDVIKSKKLINNEQLKARVFQFVSDRLKAILKKYGAMQFTIPSFTPVNSLSKFNLNHAFSVCDNNGSIIQPPYDLRIPFARFVARNQNLSNIPIFKRYAIDKVYRSRIVGHPKELYEFAYDIVTTQTGVNWPILPDVEVLLVLNQIIDSFECLKNKPFTLRVNSIKFLKAVFTFFEIDEQHFDQVLKILAESNDRNFVSKTNDSEHSKTSKDHITYMLSSNNILESNKINVILQMLLENEKNSAKEMMELVHFYMRRKSQPKQKRAYDEAMDAIKELGLIIDCLQNSCNTFRMKIKFVPNLVLNLSNCAIYSRLIFQLQYDVAKKHQILHSILATGGRYDDLIENFQVNFCSKQDQANEKALIFAEQRMAVGFSVEIEKIVKCVIEDDEQVEMEETSDCDLVLYTEINEDERYRFICKDLCQIAHELRTSGYRVKVLNEKMVKSSNDLNKFCSENLIKFLFILVKSKDQQKSLYQIKARIFEKEKFFDRRSNNLMNCHETIEYIKSEMLSLVLNSSGNSSSPFNASFNVNQLNTNFSFESSSCSISSNYLSTNNNFVTNINTSNIKYQSPDLSATITSKIAAATNIQFIEVEKTFELLSKKKVLALISSSISNKLSNFLNNSIEVLVLEVPFKVLKLVVYESDFEKDGFGNFSQIEQCQSIKRMIDAFPKYRTQIEELMHEIVVLKSKREPPLVILCSVNDLHNFKFVIVP